MRRLLAVLLLFLLPPAVLAEPAGEGPALTPAEGAAAEAVLAAIAAGDAAGLATLAVGEPEIRALRAAQAHVRAQERWRHPAFWDVWVL